MKLACSSGMVPGTTFTEKAHNLYRWGYTGMTVFADYDTFNDKILNELIHLEANTGVCACEFLWTSDMAGQLMSKDPQKKAATKKIYRECAEICAQLGAVTEIEYLYCPQDPLPLFDIYQKMSPEDEAEFLEHYRWISQPVIGTEAAVLLEGINRYESPYMNTLADCKEVAAKTGLKETGVLADFFHMSIEEANIPQSILDTGDAIRHVHLGDSNRCMPGKGYLDWESSFRALKQIGYTGYLNMECSTLGDPEHALPEGAAFVKNILERITL